VAVCKVSPHVLEHFVRCVLAAMNEGSQELVLLVEVVVTAAVWAVIATTVQV